MTDYSKILKSLAEELQSSLQHLKYSFEKINRLRLSTTTRDVDALEVFEALVSRFARTTDIFIAKYLRAICEKDDPGFRGSLVDTIYHAEKSHLVQSAKTWIEIRELRNRIAHEYTSRNLHLVFEQVLAQTPTVLALETLVR